MCELLKMGLNLLPRSERQKEFEGWVEKFRDELAEGIQREVKRDNALSELFQLFLETPNEASSSH